MPKMKIGIDAHVLGAQVGGNESYMRQLLRALYKHVPNEDILVFVNKKHHQQPIPAYGFPAVPIPVNSSYLRVPFVLPALAKKSAIDLLHVQYTAPPFAPCPYVVSMHDIVAVRFPDSMPFRDRHRLRLLTPRTLHKAHRIFVLTNALRDEIADHYNISHDRFDLVQPAPEENFVPIENEETLRKVRQKYNLPENYLLYLGLIQPRKNLVRLARAFAQLKEHGYDHKLVIGGKRAWLYDDMIAEIDALNLGDHIHFTGYIDHEDLPALYTAADLFTYLSLYEGFGIPILEAMACGCPVLASTDPALKEVAQGAAHHVDPLDQDAITQALLKLLADTNLRDNLRKKGLQRAAHFTTQSMAQAAIKGYKKAHA